ncbi:hypothetical protein DPMN_134790, partial [Dreissena polymorpha]
ASLIWSNVILLLFKFKNCGPLPSAEDSCGPRKVPLLDEEQYEPVKVKATANGQTLIHLKQIFNLEDPLLSVVCNPSIPPSCTVTIQH